MELDEKNLNRLKKMLAIMDEDTLTREEFLKHFEKVIELVAKIQQSQNDANSKLETTYEMMAGKMRNDHIVNLSEIKKEAISQTKTEFDKIYKEHETMMGKMEEGMQNIKSEIDNKMTNIQNGKDADEKAMFAKQKTEFDKIYKEHETMMGKMEEGMQNIKSEIDNKMTNIQNGKDADEKTMTEKINQNILSQLSLQKTEIIKENEEVIKKLFDELKTNLLQRTTQTGGRFFGGSAVHKFIDDETPSGTKDGANTVFVLVKTPIAGSLKVFINGQRMRITEDYTLSNKTITFNTAPLSNFIILCDYRYF